QIVKAINLCKKHHINVYCSLIVGVPDETYADYLETKHLMKRLKPYAYGFNVFVGIPNSPLYQKILDNRIYEYQDDLGLLYLPGYDVKAKYFANLDTRSFLNHEFKEKSDFDKKLISLQYVKNIRIGIYLLRQKIRRFFKNFVSMGENKCLS
ncbi:hypothetical protein ACFLQ1_00835, partial [Candidatus Auribacterota bacterium]